MADGESMREFWDERARENPYYFVDNRLEYGQPDQERFWDGGADAIALMLDELGVKFEPDDHVLEIGCGLGRLTRVIAGRTASVRALDISSEMIRQATDLNRHLTNVEWIHGDGKSLSAIEADSVDACYSDVVFQHIPDPEVTLAYVTDMGRVLNPGGWSAFQISNSPEIHSKPPFHVRARSRLNAILGRGPRGQDHAAWLGSAVGIDDLKKAASRGGLTLERTANEGTQYCRVLLRKR